MEDLGKLNEAIELARWWLELPSDCRAKKECEDIVSICLAEIVSAKIPWEEVTIIWPGGRLQTYRVPMRVTPDEKWGRH